MEYAKDFEEVLASPGWNRAYAVGSSSRILSRVFDFLRALDALGAYDNTLVFIVADHGRAFTPVDLSFASPPLPGARNRPIRDIDGNGPLDQPNMGVPLFLVKPAGDRSALRISDAPVSLCDIPKSIFGVLGIANDFGCSSIFKTGERSKPRWHFRTDALSKTKGRELAYSRFVVVGHSWHYGSWRKALARGAAH